MNVEDKPFNSLSSSLCVFKPCRTKQRICSRKTGKKKKKKNRNEWQVLLFDFQITQASILLTWRVNKYRIQFPWSHAISWQSSKRSNRLLQGTWATVKKRKEKKKKPWVYERCWHLEQATKRDKCQILRNNYWVKHWFLSQQSPSYIPQRLTVVVSQSQRKDDQSL